MKKIFLSSIVLILFAVSVILFQISCKKDATAQQAAAHQLGKILYFERGVHGLWLASYDGSNPMKINYSVPDDLGHPGYLNAAMLSPDGKTIFIQFLDDNTIYSYNSDGSNRKKVIAGNISLSGVY